MIMPFARLARLSCKASATASAIAENAAMMPAVEKPSALTTTITSAIYKTTVTMEMMKVAADLSNRLFIVVRTTMLRTIFRMISPKMKNAIQRTIVKAPFWKKLIKKFLIVSQISFIVYSLNPASCNNLSRRCSASR